MTATISSTGLQIAPRLNLPIEMVGESTAILAKKGAGKSNTAKVIVEETLDHGGVQVIVLDPIGHWWSLRAGASGQPRGGYDIAVFGGMHGDLPLEEHAGKLIAKTAVESGQSMVLDVSGLESNGAMQRFVYELLEELYMLKQASPTPLLLVLEEADEFAPQDPKGTHVPRMVGAANRISKRGRGRGIGMLYVTQRSAALNKNVLDQADTLIVMRTMGPRDRAAIADWVKHQDAEGMNEVLPSLPSLETGEAWVWMPQRDLLERVKIRKARTYDSSWTPRAGDKAVNVKVRPIDVKALGKQIAATAEKVKENDPDALKKQIRELKTQLANVESWPPVVETEVVEVEKLVEVPILTDEDREMILRVSQLVNDASREITQRFGSLLAGMDAAMLQAQTKPYRRPESAARSRQVIDVSSSRAPTNARDVIVVDLTGEETGLTGPEQRVLDGLAWLEAVGFDQPAKIVSGFVAGYRVGKNVGGTFGNILGKLRAKGLLDYPGPGTVSLTPTGRGLANMPGIEQSTAGLQRAFMERLSGVEQRVLQVLIDAYDEPLTKQEAGARAGYSVGAAVGGTFGNILGKLRTLGLIDYPAPGMVVALPVLFVD